MKMKIESDGTIGGTKITMDGTDLTAEETVVGIDFYASTSYGNYVRFGYRTKEKDEDGNIELTSYDFHSPSDDRDEYSLGSMRKVETRGIGRPEAEAEDAEKMLKSERYIGDSYRAYVIDRRKLNNMSSIHRAALRELIGDRKLVILEDTGKGEEDEGEGDGDGTEG